MLVYDFTDCWSSWCNALLITNQIKTCYYSTSVFWMISEVIYYFLFFWNKKLACFFNQVLLAARITIWTDCKLQLVGFFLEIYLLYLEERELFCVHILMKFRVCQHICSRKKYKYTNISVKWVLFRVNPESVKRICWRQGVSLFQVLFFARFDYFSMFHNTFAARAPIWEIIKHSKKLAKIKEHISLVQLTQNLNLWYTR